MSVKQPAVGRDWTVGVKVCVERSGQLLLGKGRLQLLEAIDRGRSISAAARQMGMSYRRAWLLVQSVNEAAGEPLVEAATGGSHGGGARLTPQGRAAVAIFRSLQEQVCETGALRLSRLLADTGRATLHVSAAVSLQEVLGQLLADYALRRSDVRVRAVYGGSDELAEHLLAGGSADLFLSAAKEPMARLEKAGVAGRGGSVPLAGNVLAAIGVKELVKSVRRADHLLRPEVARVALAEPSCPLGTYAEAYLERRGLMEAVRRRALYVDNARSVIAAVRAGQAEAGIVYGTDAVAGSCCLLFRARGQFAPIRYLGAVLRQTPKREEAEALLAFLASPGAAERFRRCGFLAISRARAGPGSPAV